VALFANLNPLWTILTSFLFAGLLVGGTSMQVITGVPSDLVTAFNGLVVVLVVSVEYLRRRARAQARAAAAEGPDTRGAAGSAGTGSTGTVSTGTASTGTGSTGEGVPA